MKSFVQFVGAAFVTLLMYAIPIVLTLSFVWKWNSIFKLFMVIFAVRQLAVLFMFIFEETRKDDDA
jgi:hypothetical protein